MRLYSLFGLFGFRKVADMDPMSALFHRWADQTQLVHVKNYVLAGQNDCILSQDIFKGELFEKVKMTSFTNGNTRMLNSLWYPRSEYKAPILMFDYVQFDASKSLLFANMYDGDGDGDGDGKNKKQDYFSHMFREFLEKHPDFAEKKTKHLAPLEPILTEESMVYSHIYDEEKQKRAITVSQLYFNTYLSTFLYCGKNDTVIATRRAFFDHVRKKVEENFAVYKYGLPPSELSSFLEKGFQQEILES